MLKITLAASILFLLMMQANAQIGAMKLVGNNTKDYAIGFGAFIKSGIPVSKGADLTLEIGALLKCNCSKPLPHLLNIKKNIKMLN